MNFIISKIEIWDTQPAAVPVPALLDGDAYIASFCNYAKPFTNGYDHATLFTGLELTSAGTNDFGGN